RSQLPALAAPVGRRLCDLPRRPHCDRVLRRGYRHRHGFARERMARSDQGAAGERSVTLAQDIGGFAAATAARGLSPAVRTTIARLIYDVAGLCVAARKTDYVTAARASAASSGMATAIGH